MPVAKLLDQLPDPLAVVDAEGHIVLRNARWRAAIDPLTDAVRDLRALLERVTPLRVADAQRPAVGKLDNLIFEHRITSCRDLPLAIGGKPPFAIHQLRDIGESWRLAEERHFIERLYRTLSHCNQTLVRAGSVEQLAQGICEGLVHLGGYRYSNVSVWVSTPADGYSRIAAACEEGMPTELLDRLHAPSAAFVDGSLDALFARPVHERRKPVSVPAEAFREDFSSPLAIECYPLIDGGAGLGALIIASTPGEISRVQEFGLLEELAGDLAFGIETLRLREHNARLEAERAAQLTRERDQFAATVTAIAAMVEMRDPYTAGHQQRVRRLAERLAEKVGLSSNRIEGLTFAAAIHDIGKIGVPAEILSKPGRLSKIEYELIKIHPAAGARILESIRFPWPVADIIRQHHERIDGSGYPLGIDGDAILAEARILAVADVIEAMATHRPYRPALPLETILHHLVQQRGKTLDHEVVDAALAMIEAEGLALFDTSQASH